MESEKNQRVVGNREYWERLQDEENYFDRHPIYQGLREFSLNEYGGYDAAEAISQFSTLTPETRVVVIGCGYGRETLLIAPHVKHVWGIDVSQKLLARATEFLSAHGIGNFTPVLASRYHEDIPSGIDLVFSVVVMQHLSRALVQDYFNVLKDHLAPNGIFVVQFLEELYDGVDKRDAEMKVYEPSISWSVSQLAELARDNGLKFCEIRTQQVSLRTLWHWVHFCKQ